MTVEDSDLISSSGPEDSQKTRPRKQKKGCQCKGFSSVDTIKKEKKKRYTGSPWFQQQKAWADFMKKHLKDLRNANPVVDDKAPKLNVPNIYDPEMLNGIRAGLNAAFNLNILMVRTLHEVNVRRGKTDTFSYKQKPQFTNYSHRREDAKQIERQNLIMARLIKNPKTRVVTVKEYAEMWERMESIMESTSQFPLFWKVQSEEEAAAMENVPPPPHIKQYVTEKSAKYLDKRPRVYLEVSIKNVGVVGKMVAMLYSDYVPMTVKNFLAFCDPKASLSYKDNRFYLIFQNYYCQTGDVVENQGFGGTSIYGPYFGNEDFTLKHGERGVLTMYQKIPNRNQSQFLITFRKLESLDGHNVAFGKIIRGFHVLDTIESIGSKKTGRPKVEIYISDCDEI